MTGGRKSAAGEIVMSDSFAKVISFVVFIVLGWILRRFGILKAETFHAISGLVLYVTLPCVIASNLNGVKIEGEMLLIAFFGFATNLLFFIYAVLLTWRTKDRDRRDFIRMNMGGYSCGPFAVPYVQAFYPTTGILATCVFDVGNVHGYMVSFIDEIYGCFLVILCLLRYCLSRCRCRARRQVRGQS